MKSVILIRHVKSDWTNLLPDYDRPIREDRKEDAHRIAKEISKKGTLPQYVVISPALRAVQTAKLLCAKWHYPAESIAMDRSLYECTAADILSVVKKTKEKYKTIAIVCHNPAITDFVNQFSDSYVVNVPTAGAIYVVFEAVQWKDIKGTGKTKWVLRPKELKEVDIRTKDA